MATRRLARVIVEGGRASSSKYERKIQARIRRRSFHLDEDGEAEYRKYPRRWAGIEFADRLAALRRWLERHVGQPWDKVYSEFCRIAGDRRKMKSWHLHDHLKGFVCCAGFQDFFYIGVKDQIHRGFCCRDGFLRDNRPKLNFGPSRATWGTGYKKIVQEAKDWAAGRGLIVRGAHIFWTAAPRPVLRPVFFNGVKVGEEYPDVTAGAWNAQGRKLFGLEEKKFRSFPIEVRKELILVS